MNYLVKERPRSNTFGCCICSEEAVLDLEFGENLEHWTMACSEGHAIPILNWAEKHKDCERVFTCFWRERGEGVSEGDAPCKVLVE